MNDPHFDLPAKHTVLRSFAGHLDASPDDVYALLVRRLTPGDETGGHMLTDPDARFIVVEGDWWYRAEYRVRPETEQGAEAAPDDDSVSSVVEFEIINVAQTAHWAGALTARSVLRSAPSAFGRLLTELSDELGAAESGTPESGTPESSTDG